MPTITRLKDTNKYSDSQYKHYNQSAMYYNSKQWKSLRHSYFIRHPICEMCLRQGKIKPTEHVHHKTEFLSGRTEQERWKLLLDPFNLMSVCAACHRKIHNGELKV